MNLFHGIMIIGVLTGLGAIIYTFMQQIRKSRRKVITESCIDIEGRLSRLEKDATENLIILSRINERIIQLELRITNYESIPKKISGSA